MSGLEHPQLEPLLVTVRLFTQTEQIFAEEQLAQFVILQLMQVPPTKVV